MSQAETTQLTITQFTPTVRTDEDGNPIPPERVAGYHRSVEETTQTAVWSAPSRTESAFISDTPERVSRQRRVYVYVDNPRDVSGCAVGVTEAMEKPYSVPKTRVAIEADAVDAVEAAVKWMECHPAPANPGRTAPVDPENEMYYRERDKAAECLRVGSTVQVDHLPESVVVGRVDSAEPDNSQERQSSAHWVCETPAGVQFDLWYADSVKEEVAYTRPGKRAFADGELIEPHCVEVSNEHNLRDDVHQETYEWLKDQEGEAVIYNKGETETIQIKQVGEVRDGALNPSNGSIDPSLHDLVIDESHAGRWYPCPVDVEPGNYRVLEEGLAKSRDRYGAEILVDADQWERYGLPMPDDLVSRTDVNLAVSRPSDTAISPSDSVEEIAGIGEKTAERVWTETVGELYETAWPVPFISPQYQSKAAAQMFTVATSMGSESLTTADAVRAVVGMLGGVAYDEKGDCLGHTANTIAGNLEIEDATVGWLSSNYGIKPDYCPKWSAKSEGSGLGVFAVGDLPMADVKQGIANSQVTAGVPADEIQHYSATTILAPVTSDGKGKVAVSDGEHSYVEVSKRALEIAASITLCDLTDDEQLCEFVEYWSDGQGDGVVRIAHPNDEWSVVLDTEGWLTAEEVLEQ